MGVEVQSVKMSSGDEQQWLLDNNMNEFNAAKWYT